MIYMPVARLLEPATSCYCLSAENFWFKQRRHDITLYDGLWLSVAQCVHRLHRAIISRLAAQFPVFMYGLILFRPVLPVCLT